MFTSTAPALAHGVNTYGAMGAGIAKTFREKYPDMYEMYKAECQSKSLTPGGMFGWIPLEGPTIYNLASQDFPGPRAKLVWLGSALMYALKDADLRGYDRIAVPRIGAGIGGLDWEPVEATMRGLARQSKCDLEIWTL